MMSFAMLACRTVLAKRIDEDDCTEYYQIINLVEKLKTQGISISCNIVIEIYSTVKY